MFILAETLNYINIMKERKLTMPDNSFLNGNVVVKLSKPDLYYLENKFKVPFKHKTNMLNTDNLVIYNNCIISEDIYKKMLPEYKTTIAWNLINIQENYYNFYQIIIKNNNWKLLDYNTGEVIVLGKEKSSLNCVFNSISYFNFYCGYLHDGILSCRLPAKLIISIDNLKIFEILTSNLFLDIRKDTKLKNIKNEDIWRNISKTYFSTSVDLVFQLIWRD